MTDRAIADFPYSQVSMALMANHTPQNSIRKRTESLVISIHQITAPIPVLHRKVPRIFKSMNGGEELWRNVGEWNGLVRYRTEGFVYILTTIYIWLG